MHRVASRIRLKIVHPSICSDFRGQYGEWTFQDTQTGKIYHGFLLDHSRVKPGVVYEASHEFYAARPQGSLHHQISDKAFEEKAIKAMERHLGVPGPIARFEAKDPSRPDGWRYLTGEKDTVQWDGLWEGVDGRIYCLEVKHFMDGNKLVEIQNKIDKTLEFLRKRRGAVIVYVAGEYWSTSGGVVRTAENLGFGIVEESGPDLQIRDPELHHNKQEGEKLRKRGRKPKAK
ncbi:hypothetical protein BS47DRAFT_1355144 [Hydnum rufescens UP504]|uniref:Uncharacterized protein n=1 Tax=Hydnum rufescens UP504 TaxID=1448309 RepID=A0A9P6AEZ0_9AGAM|nr:hypothetical protein BS47DRAFT_1355144 [Hydnum rufescens UP504]